MDDVLEKLKEFKDRLDIDPQAKVVDISYYGKINLSKNDMNLKNETKEDIYLVKEEINGKQVLEFRTEKGVLARVNDKNEIIIDEAYKDLINGEELLIQLHKILPVSLEKLEEIQARKDVSKNASPELRENKKQADKNSKDVIIDMNKRITEDKTFASLVPEVKEKGIIDVRVRRLDSTKFQFYGINDKGEEVEIESLKMTEGTNPKEDIIRVNGDGSEVKVDNAYTMLKIQTGNNQGYENEGFIVTLGDYGIPEIDYYRRAPEEDKYTSIPVNLKNTNQKRTEKDVREYATKRYNTETVDNIKEAEERIESEPDEKTVLENIDDDQENNIEDYTEILIQKAAKRCKMSVESFKAEYEKVDGETVEERIENAEEKINEDYIGSDRNRA